MFKWELFGSSIECSYKLLAVACIPLWYDNDLNTNVLQKFPEERPLYLEVDNADVFRVGGAGVMDKHFVRIRVKLPKHLVKKFDRDFVPATF